jgi:hypothetical protein
MLQTMAAFVTGDRVKILVPVQGLWQSLATIVDVWLDNPRDSQRLYRVRLDDGKVVRLRGVELEAAESDSSSAANF